MIIYYPGNHPEQEAILRRLLPDKDIRKVGDAHMPMTMEQLVQMEPEPDAAAGSQEPFLFWVDEDPKEVSRIQEALHHEGADITRMAMKTEHNMGWTFDKLYHEVSAEAHWFETRDHLAELIRNANPKRIQEDPRYGQAVMSCYQLLMSDKEVPQRLLDMAVQMLEAANAQE